MALVVECYLPIEALNLNPSNTKNKKKKLQTPI
jgi:hypothetical protein